MDLHTESYCGGGGGVGGDDDNGDIQEAADCFVQSERSVGIRF